MTTKEETINEGHFNSLRDEGKRINEEYDKESLEEDEGDFLLLSSSRLRGEEIMSLVSVSWYGISLRCLFIVSHPHSTYDYDLRVFKEDDMMIRVML